MAKQTETTLTHPTLHPKTVTSKNPTTITQLKAQGYRVVDPDDDTATGYDAQKAADLKAEIDRRNADRDDATRISPDGRSHAAYKAALEADDDAQADGDGGDA